MPASHDSSGPFELLHSWLTGSPAGPRLLIDGTGRDEAGDRGDAQWERLPLSRIDSGLPRERRFALGAVIDALDRLDDARADALLAALRDRLCRRVVVVVPPESRFGRGRMLALGYTLRARGGDGWRLYDHDIDSYNPERAWNNADNWAHPDNFNRQRW